MSPSAPRVSPADCTNVRFQHALLAHLRTAVTLSWSDLNRLGAETLRPSPADGDTSRLAHRLTLALAHAGCVRVTTTKQADGRPFVASVQLPAVPTSLAA